MNNTFARQLLTRVIVYPVIAILMVTHVAMSYAQSTPDQVHTPSPVMPKPNAFDYYVKAGSLIKDQKKIVAVFDDLTKTVVNPDTPIKKTAALVYPKLGDVQKLVSENRSALATLRQGFKYPYMNPPIPSILTPLPYYVQYRNLARLLLLNSYLLSQNGQADQAFDCLIDAIKLGGDMPHGGRVISLLVGKACQATGRRAVDTIIDNISSDEAKKSVRRLVQIDSNVVTATQAWTEEKRTGLATLKACLRTVQTRHQVFGASSDDPKAPMPPGIISDLRRIAGRLYYDYESTDHVCDQYTEYMDQCNRHISLPWSQFRRTPTPEFPDDGYCADIAPISDKFFFAQIGNLTLDRILIVRVALQAYKRDHRKLPAKLSQLVPSYLPSVPTDPFADDAPLHYKMIGSRYLLYSVGPDGVDNGGKPINSGKASQLHSALTNIDRKGDIVAGVNY